ncbi:MAG: ABC transporter ATP-binding protein [Candidatus Omnitrophica bacterium]|nr:ABC transporter ATP-binding protein [Candidatus Omnitrophota bacterium]
MSSYILETKELSKFYKDASRQVAALNDINLQIESSQYIAIVGPSGAGKSTLIHILGGLDLPSSGKVFFEGRNLVSLKFRRLFSLRNKKVGFMFQFYHLLKELTALENIMLPCRLSGQKKRIVRKRAEEIARELDLSQRLNFYPSQLSGGQQQKVAFARAVINEPKVLFCDEPTGNLDHDSAENIRNLIKKLNAAHKTTVVLVTHNLELAKDAQRVLNIKDGRITN